MTNTEQQQVHAVVQGRVQGVGFRDFTQRRAAELGLNGWVRNQPDGTVETVAEGDKATLEQFIAHLWRGPVSARVIRVETEWRAATGRFSGFNIRG
jgi:acylphosphatase